ncbi:MAG: hypothetical protein H7A22_09040 [Spirochaetales bacterium]|nr:hypothetical protein [Spirochaetales bacterium]
MLSCISRQNRPAILAGTALSFLLFRCDLFQKESGSDLSALALVLAGSCNCQIGNVCFSTSGSVSCQSGVASGTGSLIASSLVSDDLSVQVTFQLSSGGQLEFIGGANPNSTFDSSAGANITIPATGNLKSTSDGGAGVAGPGTAAVTYCMEHHVEESPIHQILDKATCASKLATAASYEYDASGPSAAGGRWGFILTNAQISGITRNASRFFTE